MGMSLVPARPLLLLWPGTWGLAGGLAASTGCRTLGQGGYSSRPGSRSWPGAPGGVAVAGMEVVRNAAPKTQNKIKLREEPGLPQLRPGGSPCQLPLPFFSLGQ